MTPRAPLDLTLWVARLQSEVGSLNTVGLAGDLQQVQDITRAVPAAWVLPGSESVPASAESPTPRRRMLVTVELVLALRHYGDTHGGQATDALRVLRKDCWAALVGWQPADATVPVVNRGGQPIGLNKNAMWFRDRFQTSIWS